MSELTPGQQILAGLKAGKVPPPIKAAAAKGALPIEADELVPIQVFLLSDEDEAVRQAASQSLGTVSEELAMSLVTRDEADQHVLAFIAKYNETWTEPAAAIARRADLPVETMRVLAASQADSILSSLSANHRALEQAPEVGQLLVDNAALSSGAKTKLLDFLEEQAKKSAQATPAQEPATPQLAEGLKPASDPFLAALGIDAEVEALLPSLDLDLGGLTEKSELLGEDEDDDSLIQRLSKLNVGQKLRIALFGTREERSVLIRDSNRLVSSAVVKNPKFTEAEAEAVSNSRNVSVDVLRLVARHRDFSHNYTIQHNLVRNPRTPADISMRFITTIHDRDLKLLLKNRNVGDAVRRHARKIIQARESRRRVRIGKKH